MVVGDFCQKKLGSSLLQHGVKVIRATCFCGDESVQFGIQLQLWFSRWKVSHGPTVRRSRK